METVACALRTGKELGMKVIVNPAPANKEVKDYFNLIDILTPNEHEAEMLSGIKIENLADAQAAARKIQEMGVKDVIITLGKAGAAILENGSFYHVPARVVEAVDTTAAGDVFNGALAVAISEGKSLKEAAEFGCIAASIAVTRMGAQASIPYRNELILELMKKRINPADYSIIKQPNINLINYEIINQTKAWRGIVLCHALGAGQGTGVQQCGGETGSK